MNYENEPGLSCTKLSSYKTTIYLLSAPNWVCPWVKNTHYSTELYVLKHIGRPYSVGLVYFCSELGKKICKAPRCFWKMQSRKIYIRVRIGQSWSMGPISVATSCSYVLPVYQIAHFFCRNLECGPAFQEKLFSSDNNTTNFPVTWWAALSDGN